MLGGAATVSIVTILGALLMGVTRQAAAEFSFFLAVPTLAGAAAMISTRTGILCRRTGWN